MHIGIVKDAVLPAVRYGGTERVAYSLARALSDMGHKVTLFCRAGSEAPFTDIVIPDPRRPLAEQIPAGVDIMHFNDVVPEGFNARPYIVTVNGNLAAGAAAPAMAVFVSRNHAERHGSQHYVYNGLDWDDYPTPDLHVLGGTRLNLKMGFRFTASPRIRFHGMVDNEVKCRYICRSKGLVFPVLWDEPFGLCLTESFFYGAPVFGTPRGSLPEIVTPDVGFLSTDERELSRHLAEAHEYSPLRCHEYAADTFGAAPMARAYMAVYERVLNGARW